MLKWACGILRLRFANPFWDRSCGIGVAQRTAQVERDLSAWEHHLSGWECRLSNWDRHLSDYRADGLWRAFGGPVILAKHRTNLA